MADSMAALAEHAPAKINLALHVTGQRADGYHILESLAVFCAFGDRLTVAPAASDDFHVDGPLASGVPLDTSNLVLRARDALRARHRQSASPVVIRLRKNIPVASGVGGGSSDAAAALRALARLWRLGLDLAELTTIGAALGADLPMCLMARPLLAHGTGERLTPVDDFPALDLVLVNPDIALSTPAVFAALSNKANAPLPALPSPLSRATLLKWLGTTRNDLSPPALSLAPAIGLVLDALTAHGADFARMSGSGATCFGIFADAAAAQTAVSRIGADNPGWFVTATSTT